MYFLILNYGGCGKNVYIACVFLYGRPLCCTHLSLEFLFWLFYCQRTYSRSNKLPFNITVNQSKCFHQLTGVGLTVVPPQHQRSMYHLPLSLLKIMLMRVRLRVLPMRAWYMSCRLKET